MSFISCINVEVFIVFLSNFKIKICQQRKQNHNTVKYMLIDNVFLNFYTNFSIVTQ